MKPLVGAFNKNCRNKKYVVLDFHKNYADSTFQNFHHCQLHMYIFIFELHDFFFFNQGSSGGLPTLGIQDVLRAILVELDDWLKLVAYSSNPIHSFPRLNWQKKKEKKKEKYPARTYAFWRKKLMKIHTARLSYVQQLIFVTFDMPFYHHVKAMPSSTASLDLVVFLPVILLWFFYIVNEETKKIHYYYIAPIFT